MSDAGIENPVDLYWMRYAAELARRGWYSTPPNPRVGCVLVRGERVVGRGWHERTGEAHAEQRALADAGQRAARGATAYVTLEPCSVHGRTPPCSEALRAAGVARVVVGAHDPNPAVYGRGIARLKQAGVTVTAGVARAECRALNPGFETRMRTGRPRVQVKLAMSLDGRTAAADGSSQWITGEAARRDGHRLRAAAGAVMVGRGTQRADDPTLSVRLAGDWRQPRPVVLDRELAINNDARLLNAAAKPWLFTASQDRARVEALTVAGAEVTQVPAIAGGLALDAVLSHLARDGEINDVLVEAGPTLAGALAEGGWADTFVIYMAPRLLGDAGRGLLGLPGVATLADGPPVTIDRIDPIGDDWRIVARPQPVKC